MIVKSLETFYPSLFSHSFFLSFSLFLTFKTPLNSFLFLLSKMEIKITLKCLFPAPLPLPHHFTVGFLLPKHLWREIVEKVFYWPQTSEENLSFFSPQVKILAINNWRFWGHSDTSGFLIVLTNMNLWWLQACCFWFVLFCFVVVFFS